MDVKATVLNSIEHATAGRAEDVATRAGREKDIKKVKELAKDFESIFLEQMLRTMRSSIQKSGLVDGGNAEEIYRSMLDSEYAKLMAGEGGAGLAQMIERQLLQTMGVKSEASSDVARKSALNTYQKTSVSTLQTGRKEVTIKP
jgi:flagellar protein FlgJ